MTAKLILELPQTNFKAAPRNPLDIPTGPLDKPLTTGYEVCQWLKKNAFLTTRYRFRYRARGKGWHDSMPLDTAERLALYIDEKDDYNRKMEAERDRLEHIQNVKDDFYNLNSSISSFETIYEEEVIVKTKR
tara:strand:- start:433 stop:828 length:396 start_codon:yes stop_codon:yes gene_type:complete